MLLLLFSGSWYSSVLVLFNVALVDLNLFGLIWYWGLELNSVTMLSIILAFGLAVDYSAHIAHAYNCSEVDVPLSASHSNFEKRKSKVRGAFKKMGGPVFHGAFSTFLAIVALSGSESYIFRAFFKQWFGIVVFGMLHGYVLLPVLLSLVGPLKKTRNKFSIKRMRLR